MDVFEKEKARDRTISLRSTKSKSEMTEHRELLAAGCRTKYFAKSEKGSHVSRKEIATKTAEFIASGGKIKVIEKTAIAEDYILVRNESIIWT